MAHVLFVCPAGLIPPENLVLLQHELVVAANGTEALNNLEITDAVVVDAREELAAARSSCQVLAAVGVEEPVMLLVAPESLSVVSPEWGIDDLILESARPAEWELRLRLLIAPHAHSTLSSGSIEIDESACTATVDGNQLDLTYTEFELLKFLVAHPGRVLSREELLKNVWGYDYYGGTRTVDVHVRRLRAKLSTEYDQCIGTVRNVGYRFDPRA
ncbi:transcriptional regulatory protein, C-terminal domain protein [Propionibacterium acidifaciens F0233]|uniref:Transcriptional regulatory protein, C-terminal domain protein n=1 Tax=Propionibacterium acidifaciens F0233 TaxID=553198 RepID=U2QX14_9ACTN|nr:response regulator transcription factor [Propionibacterium acidifaciens]AYW78119.1 DNA-binding response regulator [Propionibacterium acidifaciens]ERK61066.1 transcriptional regulatory protein, C-terminal domain protein [Propionibacterium acidifaciens F0233]